MKTRELMVELTDWEVEEWDGLPPTELEAMIRQGVEDRLSGKNMQNPGHAPYRKGYSNYSTIEELIDLVHRTFKSKAA